MLRNLASASPANKLINGSFWQSFPAFRSNLSSAVSVYSAEDSLLGKETQQKCEEILWKAGSEHSKRLLASVKGECHLFLRPENIFVSLETLK